MPQEESVKAEESVNYDNVSQEIPSDSMQNGDNPPDAKKETPVKSSGWCVTTSSPGVFLYFSCGRIYQVQPKKYRSSR
jgi:hypothetical protein